MIKYRKFFIVLSGSILLCLCLLLSACGKNNGTPDVQENTTVSQEQADDRTKESKPGDDTAKESGQKQDQPKVVHQKNGSGVETIGSSDQSGQTEQKPSSEKTTEVKPEQGVEPVEQSENPTEESKSPVEQSEASNPTSPPLSTAAKEYADYCGMSSEQQYAYYKSFKSADAFLEWYNAAKAAYEKENPTIELNPGDVIDLGD